jgi:gamma-glutamyltranspeptidase/glutathione hydrolase
MPVLFRYWSDLCSMRRFAYLFWMLLSVIVWVGPARGQSLRPDHPEAASGWTPKTTVYFERQAVATANPFASQAGLEILRQGGSAVDAAIAAQLVLTLVEPQSSGIGGGAFLMHFDGQRVQSFDGRETAPARVPSDLFMENGQPMAMSKAIVGGRSVGTPGLLRMLALAHQQHGRLPWEKLFIPAIRLSTDGFPMSPRLYRLLRLDRSLRNDSQALHYFYQDDGKPKPIGSLLKNPGLARILEKIAHEGPDAFYQGEIADAIVKTVQGHPTNPGWLSHDDLRGYRAKEREPICFIDEPSIDRPRYRLCGFPPPGSGTIAIAQTMAMMRTLGIAQDRGVTDEWLHAYTEAARRAFADRAAFVADPDYVAPPAWGWMSLLQPRYLERRAQEISTNRSALVQAGDPADPSLKISTGTEPMESGTSHISVIDRNGNAVAMTTTIESVFGSRLMVSTGEPGGFMLNNQLTDFGFIATDRQGRPLVNRIEPGKRSRSSMSPTLIFESNPGQKESLVAALGSPGGASIIHYVAKTIYGLLYWGLDAQKSIDLPNFSVTTTNGQLQLEKAQRSPESLAWLRARGHSPIETDLPSGIQVLERISGKWRGGADPRREGSVAGD